MIALKSIEDLKGITNLNHLLVIGELLRVYIEGFNGDDVYIPENSGWMVYVESPEDCDKIEDLNFRGSCMWEGVASFDTEGLFEIIVLYNNEFCMSYFIPFENLGVEFRRKLADETKNGIEATHYNNIADRLPHLHM
jgi:hypothetical protein